MRDALASGRAGIADVAQLASTSPSTLQRALSDNGTNYLSLRKSVRLKIALTLLTRGESLRRAAAEVVLSPDHLSVIVKEETDVCPRQIIRATELARRVAKWQGQAPPSYGSPLYHRRKREWEKIDEELTTLLGDFSASHPLATWAKALLVSIERPDYRSSHIGARYVPSAN